MFSTQWVKGHADKIIRRLELNLSHGWVRDRSKRSRRRSFSRFCDGSRARGANETAHRAIAGLRAGFSICDRHRPRRARSVAGLEWCVGADSRRSISPRSPTHWRWVSCCAPSTLTKAHSSRAARFGWLHWYSSDPANFAQRDGRKFDFDKAEWRIPAARMKARVQHIVPLSTQADCRSARTAPAHRQFTFAFPSVRSRYRADERKYHHRRASPHGLHRPGHDRPWISQYGLNLAQRAGVESRCNRTATGAWRARRCASGLQLRAHLSERRRMMQAWADYLDKLKNGSGDAERSQNRAA